MLRCKTLGGSTKNYWKRRLRSGSLVALIVAAMTCTALAQGDSDTGEEPHPLSVHIKAFLQAIQDSLADARRYNDQPPYFLVKRIKLELSVIRSMSAGGGVEFEVPVLPLEIDGSGNRESAATESVSMTLKPAPQTLVGAAEKIKLAELMRAVKSTLSVHTGSGGLSLTELTYATRFYLQTSVGGGIKFAMVKADAEGSETNSQLVEFKLCQTIDMLDCVE